MTQDDLAALRWKSTAIERDRYRESLDRNRDRLWSLWQGLRDGVAPTLEQITEIASDVESAWRFRQHPCPRCHEPCEFIYAMSIVGPHVMVWRCPACGVIRREGFGDYVVVETGEVVTPNE